MLWFFLIALALLGAVVVVLVGRWDGAEAPEEEGPGAAGDDVGDLLQRGSGLSAEDIDEVVFDSAPRGYRMDQVDRLLDALAAQLRDQQGSAASAAQSGSPECPDDQGCAERAG